MSSGIRLRIAPSPTGFPHIGTIYQALFNYAFAKKNEGKFLVRIEDTDRARLVKGAEEMLFNVLDWFGLPEDESPRKEGQYGPYRQSERLATYHKYAQELLDQDKAYFAYYPKDAAGNPPELNFQRTKKSSFETTDKPPKTIKEMLKRGDWILRMRIPKEKKIVIKDEIRGEIVFDSSQVTEQVLLKSDGYPTYHLAVVVDDHLMGITHVVRGEEWISSTPKHVLLYEYFGWEKPLFFHTPDLRNPDKSKLSKRHGHTDVNWYRSEGYLPEAILNFLALLGWSHPTEKEIFSLEEFISLFNLKDLKPIGPVFDLTKLTWMNQQYIQNMTEEKLIQKILSFYSAQNFSKEFVVKILPLVKTRMQKLTDFIELTAYFTSGFYVSPRNPEEEKIAASLYKAFADIPVWQQENILRVLKDTLDVHKIRMPVLYYLFTGQEKGLPLPESLEILGKEETLARLQKSTNDNL